MSSKDNVPLTELQDDRRNISFKATVLRKLCPGKNLHDDSWLPDELSDAEMESVKNALRRLMPMDTIVTDMWDWDIRFENITFDDTLFNVAFGSDGDITDHAELLKEDIMSWIEQYRMDYGQEQWDEDEFVKWAYDQCVDFIARWRANIVAIFS